MTKLDIFSKLAEAGLTITIEKFTKFVNDVNVRRLGDKRKKVREDNRKVRVIEKIQLTNAESLNGSVTLNINLAQENIMEHVGEVKRWADGIKFSDLASKKSLSTIYVQLDTYLIPANKQFDKKEKTNTLPLEVAVLNGNDHCVILGQPGAGKTTSLKKICELVNSEHSKIKYTFPILLRLRQLGDFTTSSPIQDFISKLIPFEFEFNADHINQYSPDMLAAREEAIVCFLNNINPIIILDGFDELRDSSAKKVVLSELRRLAGKLSNSKMVLSCRTGEFSYELEQSNTYEIAPLSPIQIELFVNKWLGDPTEAKKFLSKVKHSPFADTSIKPLSLAHLCAIYERVGSIPDQPKTIYRKVVQLLIEEWDEQRSIVRNSAFSGFQSYQKIEFLTSLSFFLTTEFKSSVFTIEQLLSAYKSIHLKFELPEHKAAEVVRELESHTGVFIESGYGQFEFVHKSIQEFLTADHIVKLLTLNSLIQHFEYLGSELAIAVSISSNSSLYYIELVLHYFSRHELSNSFYNSFVSRIVAENPTFANEDLVGPAALLMLASWINPGNKKVNLNKESEINLEMFKPFFQLADCLSLGVQGTSVFKYYRLEQEIYQNTYVELKKIRILKGYERFPNKIYIPTPFYKVFTNQ